MQRLYVSPRARAPGLGRALVAAVIGKAVQMGYHEMGHAADNDRSNLSLQKSRVRADGSVRRNTDRGHFSLAKSLTA
jgi:GNAT superfamily N-acetyltransferase